MIPRLTGMVHLGPLPGSPGFDGDFDVILNAAARDAAILETAGFDAVMVENFGDAPFYGDDVPKLTVAAMTRAVSAVTDAVEIPVGVNVLRNDARAALAIAAATGASMIRVNVLSGVMFTDQGTVQGRAAEVARLRATIAPGVAVLADVMVKHAVPPAGLTLADAVHDLVERAGAHAVIVSGPATGAAADAGEVALAVESAGKTPVLVGSGVDAGNVAALLAVAHGAIVGTAVKEGRVTTAPVDPEAARRLVDAAR